jgi:hypothetical protein
MENEMRIIEDSQDFTAYKIRNKIRENYMGECEDAPSVKMKIKIRELVSPPRNSLGNMMGNELLREEVDRHD